MDKKGHGLGSLPQPKGGKASMQALSDDQKKTVKEILAKYDPTTLSQEDAKAIFEALENVEIYGPEVFAEVQRAGIDPQKLFAMAMEGEKLPPSPQKG